MAFHTNYDSIYADYENVIYDAMLIVNYYIMNHKQPQADCKPVLLKLYNCTHLKTL